MPAIYDFLGTHELLIYLLLTIGGLFGLRWLWRAWNEWRRALYSLEKEYALRRIGQALATLLLVLLLSCAEMFAASFIFPGLPATLVVPTATADLFATPTGTITAELATAFAMTPFSGGPDGEGCDHDRVNIMAPKAGSEIHGTIDILGTVNITDFGFYKYEVALAGSDAWATISAGRDKVINGSLGQWDTSALTPGDYQLRLVVTDNQGKSLPACVVPVRITPQT